MNIGDVVKSLRFLPERSLSSVSKSLGITIDKLKKIEGGDCSLVTIDLLKKISSEYRIPIYDLLVAAGLSRDQIFSTEGSGDISWMIEISCESVRQIPYLLTILSPLGEFRVMNIFTNCSPVCNDMNVLIRLEHCEARDVCFEVVLDKKGYVSVMTLYNAYTQKSVSDTIVNPRFIERALEIIKECE